jgi:hypothetical protein
MQNYSSIGDKAVKNSNWIAKNSMDMTINHRMQEGEICIHTGDAGGT